MSEIDGACPTCPLAQSAMKADAHIKRDGLTPGRMRYVYDDCTVMLTSALDAWSLESKRRAEEITTLRQQLAAAVAIPEHRR